MVEIKYVKLFEQLDQEGVLDSEESKKELRRGQKAAASRGDDILTDVQYAACYINAIRSLERAEDTRGMGDTALTRIALKMNQEASDNWQNASSAKLAAYLNLKPLTVARTVSKFKLLLQGQREGTESNIIWPELVNLFDRFESMPKAEVISLAEEAITSEPDMTAYQAYLDKMNAKSKESLEKKKKTEKSMFDKTMSMFKSLRSRFDGLKAARLAMNKLVQDSMDKDEAGNPIGEPAISKDKLRLVMMDGLKKDPVIMKYFKDAYKKPVEKPESVVIGRGQEQGTE
jgi:hypothetical protein